MKRQTRGFTLSELLIVVAILAILVAIAIPIFTTQLNKAGLAADQANERILQSYVTEWVNTGSVTLSLSDGSTRTLNKGDRGDFLTYFLMEDGTLYEYIPPSGTHNKIPTSGAVTAQGTDPDNYRQHQKGAYLCLNFYFGSMAPGYPQQFEIYWMKLT